MTLVLPADASSHAKGLRTCPKCKAHTHTDRVPRSFLVKKLLGWTSLRRYQCYKCKQKFYSLK